MTDDAGEPIVVLYRGDTEVDSWPLGRFDHLDLATADELARLQLLARRLGFAVRLRHAGTMLLELLDLTGLAAVVPAAAAPQSSRWAGSAKAANSEVSRKLWCPMIRSPDTSSTWMDHGTCPPAGSTR